MYKKTQNKRRRIKMLRFFELTILPLLISGLILMIIVWIMIEPCSVRFSSVGHMIAILAGIVIIIGSTLFEISRIIIKKILHYSTMDFFQKTFKRLLKTFKRLFKKGYGFTFP